MAYFEDFEIGAAGMVGCEEGWRGGVGGPFGMGMMSVGVGEEPGGDEGESWGHFGLLGAMLCFETRLRVEKCFFFLNSYVVLASERGFVWAARIGIEIMMMLMMAGPRQAKRKSFPRIVQFTTTNTFILCSALLCSVCVCFAVINCDK